MSKSNSATKIVHRLNTSKLRRAPEASAPPFAARSVSTEFDPHAIRAVVEMLGGAGALTTDVQESLGAACFRDWHAAFVVRGAAEKGLSPSAVLRVLIEVARGCASRIESRRAIHAFDETRVAPAMETLKRCEALLSGQLDLDDPRLFYELRGMVDHGPKRDPLFAFVYSLLDAVLDQVASPRELAWVSPKVERAAQHMVCDLFRCVNDAIERAPVVSSRGIGHPLDAQATTRCVVDVVIDELQALLSAALVTDVRAIPAAAD